MRSAVLVVILLSLVACEVHRPGRTSRAAGRIVRNEGANRTIAPSPGRDPGGGGSAPQAKKADRPRALTVAETEPFDHDRRAGQEDRLDRAIDIIDPRSGLGGTSRLTAAAQEECQRRRRGASAGRSGHE